MKTKLIGSKRLKKKGVLVKTRLEDRCFAKEGGSANIKTCPALNPGPETSSSAGLIQGISGAAKAMNTVFLDLRTSVEDCVAIIKAFEGKGCTTYYDAKTKVLKTTAPKTKIKKLSKIYDCIQSYSLAENYNRPEAQ